MPASRSGQPGKLSGGATGNDCAVGEGQGDISDSTSARGLAPWRAALVLALVCAGLCAGLLGTVPAAVAQIQVPSNWPLKPTGLGHGDEFRLLFATSDTHNGASSHITTYNSFVRRQAAIGHNSIRSHFPGFRVVGCTARVDARDNTGTTGTGVPIYWLNGNKVADNNADFYNGNWDNESNPKNQNGGNRNLTGNNRPYTGCRRDGTTDRDYPLGPGPLGLGDTRLGSPDVSGGDSGPLSGLLSAHGENRPLYALSWVFRVVEAPPPVTPGLGDLNTVWSATMTVGQTSGNTRRGFIDQETDVGSLSNRGFTWPAGGTNYSIAELHITTGSNPHLRLKFSPDGWSVFYDLYDNTEFALYIGDREFSLADASNVDNGKAFEWRNTGLSWADGETVEVKLTRVTPPKLTGGTVSSDGTAIDLTFHTDLDIRRLPPQWYRYPVQVYVDGRRVFALELTAPSRSNPRLVRVSDFAYQEHNRLDAITGRRWSRQPMTISPGQRVTVSYVDPSSVDDGLAIQDVSGNDAKSFYNRYVVPRGPTKLRSAKTNTAGDRLILRFSKALDDRNSAAADENDFTVKVNGTEVDLDNVDTNPSAEEVDPTRTIHLQLDGTVIRLHDTVTVSYENVAPMSSAIQQSSGSEALSFTDVKVENKSTEYVSGCTASNEVWCATMTVGSASGNFGFFSGGFGSLSDDDFVYDDTGYDVIEFFIAQGELVFALDPAGRSAFDRRAFTLFVNGTRFSLNGAYNSGEQRFEWSGSGLSWSEDDTVSVRLVKAGGGQSAPPVNDPLTASVDDRPDSHDGETAFKVRLNFSEALKNRRLGSKVVRVDGGTNDASERVEGDDEVWEIEIAPAGTADVTIELAAGEVCGSGLACTEGDLRPLSETLTFTVPGPDNSPSPIRPLNARIDHAPAEHDGSSQFEVRVEFSEPIANSFRHVDDAATVSGGAANSAKRVDKQNHMWNLRVVPAGNGPVTVTLAGGGTCGEDHPAVLCTADGRSLSHTVSVTVPGPEALSVADAEATEGVDETMDFTVSLDRPAVGTVTVDYATRDGTATAPGDYTETEGTLTFTDGEDTKTVSVPIVDDGHDDGGETFALVLSNAQGARIADDEAVGTIRNSDAMPRAWIARFGRTVAEQVIDAVESRMRAPRTPGAEVSLAGQRIGLGPVFGGGAEAGGRREDTAREARRQEAEAARETARLADWLRHETDPEQRRTAAMRTATGAELMLGSSFALTAAAEGRAGGTVSLWGRAAVSRFDGREGRMTLDGEVASGLLGADWSRGRATAGLIVGHSRGEGGYRSESGTGGTVSSTLTGLYPWGRYALSERVSVWGLAGYGEGTLTLTPEGSDGKSLAAIRTDLDLTMAAAGLRGVLIQAPETGGLELAVKTDAMGVRTSTAKVGSSLSAAKAEVTRLRLGLEGARPFRFEGGATLTPSVEIGVRQDGGDAETGFGADIGGGLAWSDPKRGLSAEIRGRGLLAHEAKGFRERGLSGSLGFDPTPQSDRGLTLSMSQTVGAASSGGMEGLLSRGTLEGLAANDNGGGDGNDLAQRRFEMKLGYGFSAFSDRFTMTPELGLGFSNSGRDYSLGWRLVRGSRYGGALELALEARRREIANAGSGSGADSSGAAEHSIGFKLTSRF